MTLNVGFFEKNFPREGYFVFAVFLFLWLLLPDWIHRYDRTSASIDPAIWLLILLALLVFLMAVALNWWLLQRFWFFLGLPALGLMVSQFKSLELWQQLGFYWASFALLLLVSTMCLMAIC